MAVLSSLGRLVSRAGTSKSGLMGTAAAAGTLGMLNTTVPAVKDAALESAFGDPNADQFFTGRDLDARFLVGGSIGGIAGTAMQLTSPGDYAFYNTPAPTATNTIASGAAGAGLGFLGARGLGGGMRATIASTAVAGAIGFAGPTLGMAAMARNNSNFFSNSAYGRRNSSQTSLDLSAVGDIVLGMHNSRGGM